MNDTYRLDRAAGALFDGAGRRFDAAMRTWQAGGAPAGDAVSSIDAATWLQQQSGFPIRVPVGVIGPREVSAAQYAAAQAVGHGLARIGFVVLCGGRSGVMEAACKGAAEAGGTSIGLLPDRDAAPANRYASIVLASGLGEARNALIARAAFCLVAIGDSFGTLSEVALGRQFGKLVIGLAGAAQLDGVQQVETAQDALELVARLALADVALTEDRG